MNTILYDLARKTPICFRRPSSHGRAASLLVGSEHGRAASLPVGSKAARPWVFKNPDIVAQIVFIQSFSLMYVLLQCRPSK